MFFLMGIRSQVLWCFCSGIRDYGSWVVACRDILVTCAGTQPQFHGFGTEDFVLESAKQGTYQNPHVPKGRF